MSDRKDSEEHTLVECSAKHDGKKVMDEKLRIKVDALFDLLFATPSAFIAKFHELRNSTNFEESAWKANQDGEMQRTVKVTVELQACVGPKNSDVTEYQTVRQCSKPGTLYSIDVRAENKGVPYAESFNVFMHYCLEATMENQTKVLVFAEVRYIKSVWAVVRSFIESHTYAALDEFFRSLYTALEQEMERRESISRRTLRGTMKQVID